MIRIFKLFSRFIKRLFNPKKELPYNIYHPELAQHIELAFECKGVEYYRMSSEFRLPAGRFKFIDTYLQEHDLRMTPELQIAFLDKIESSLNGTGKGNQINLTTALVTIHNMKTRVNAKFDVDTIQRLSSVVYFDDTEDLRDFDPEHGRKKVSDWLSDGKYSFFLTRPIDELLNIRGISVESLQAYIQEQQDIIKSLTSDHSTPSTPNSSETGTGK